MPSDDTVEVRREDLAALVDYFNETVSNGKRNKRVAVRFGLYQNYYATGSYWPPIGTIPTDALDRVRALAHGGES